MWLFTQPGVSREPVKGSRCPTTLNLKEPTESSARALSIRQCFCAKIAHADAYLYPLSYSQSWCSPFTPLTHPCSLCHSRQLGFSFFFFFNDTSLREKILMLQIENRPVFFFFSKSLSFWKSSPDCSAAAELVLSTDKESTSLPTHAWVTTEDKRKRACWRLQKNEKINRKRQDGKWVYNIWGCDFKCFITLSEWQIFNRISSPQQQTSFQNNLPFVFTQLWDALWSFISRQNCWRLKDYCDF